MLRFNTVTQVVVVNSARSKHMVAKHEYLAFYLHFLWHSCILCLGLLFYSPSLYLFCSLVCYLFFNPFLHTVWLDI